MAQVESQTDIEIEGDDEEEISIEIEKSKRKIYSKSTDPEIDSLYQRWKRGKLVRAREPPNK